MKPVRFIEEARLEFLAEVAFYEEVQRGLGEKFNLAVEAATQLAATFPMAGTPWMHSTRRVFPKNFPFSVVYRVEPGEIVVFAVAHFSRRPAYWRDRKGDA